MDSCSIIEFLLSQNCEYNSAEKINYHLQDEYITTGFIMTIIAKHLNVCTKSILRLNLRPDLLINNKIMKGDCEIDYFIHKNKCAEKFEVIPVSVTSYNEKFEIIGSHTIIILVDHQDQVCEIFDSNGSLRNNKICDIHLIQFLNKNYPNYEILFPEIICPYGPQVINDENTCTLWSILYLFMRIKCEHSTRNDINRLFYDIQTKQLFNKKSISARVTKLIKGFGCYLEDLLSQLNLQPFAQYFEKIRKHMIESDDFTNEMLIFVESSYSLLLLRDYVYYLKLYKLYTPEIDDIINSNPFLYSLI